MSKLGKNSNHLKSLISLNLRPTTYNQFKKKDTMPARNCVIFRASIPTLCHFFKIELKSEKITLRRPT
jgi:hypothetical protein